MAFCSMDNEISLWVSEILHDILFGKAKFRATVHLGEQNFVHHFASESEISWNISFIGVEIKLNVDEIKKSRFKRVFAEIYKYTHIETLRLF